MTPQRLPAALFASMALLTLPAAVQAIEQTYDFTGRTSVGGTPHRFDGVFIYDDAVAPQTVYQPGQVAPVQQGFQSQYLGAVVQLSIRLDNGEAVAASTGWLQVNNIQQAEIGSQVPAGLSLQAWTAGATGTINGLSVSNLYLAFLPVAPNFSWDLLDSYLGANAESLLQADPAQLPAGIDPSLTGTALPALLPQTFSAGLFLGTNHGLTNTVNEVNSFSLRAALVPEPGAAPLLLGGLGLLALLRRQRAQRVG